MFLIAPAGIDFATDVRPAKTETKKKKKARLDRLQSSVQLLDQVQRSSKGLIPILCDFVREIDPCIASAAFFTCQCLWMRA